MQLVIASESLGKERGGPTWRRHYETACAVYSSPIALGKDLAQVRLLLAPQRLRRAMLRYTMRYGLLAYLLAYYFASLLHKSKPQTMQIADEESDSWHTG